VIAAGVVVYAVLFVRRHEHRLLIQAEVEMAAHEEAVARRRAGVMG